MAAPNNFWATSEVVFDTAIDAYAGATTVWPEPESQSNGMTDLHRPSDTAFIVFGGRGLAIDAFEWAGSQRLMGSCKHGSFWRRGLPCEPSPIAKVRIVPALRPK